MYNREDATRTRRRGLTAVLRDFYELLFHPPKLAVRLREGGRTLRPAMSRREIRRVADAICRAAQLDAK